MQAPVTKKKSSPPVRPSPGEDGDVDIMDVDAEGSVPTGKKSTKKNVNKVGVGSCMPCLISTTSVGTSYKEEAQPSSNYGNK